MNIRRLNFYRYFFYWLNVVFSVVVPVIVVAHEYDLVEATAPQKYRVTGMGIILAICLLFYFRNELKNMLELVKNEMASTAYKDARRAVFLLILFFALKVAEIHMRKFQLIVFATFISNSVAVGFHVLHVKYRDLAIEEKKKLKGVNP